MEFKEDQMPSFEKLDLGSLETPLYRNPVDENFVGEIIVDFEPFAVGSMIINRRKNGALFIVDGLHRVEALRRLGYGGWLFTIMEAEEPEQ